MSLNFEKEGAILGVCKGGNMAGKYISVDTEKTLDSGEKTYQDITLSSGKFQPTMNYNKERFVGYIVGSSGSGKSYYIKEWVKQYKKRFKKNPVYVLSSLSEDETLDEIKPKRVILDDAFAKEKIDLEMYRDCLVIFDDTDTITEKHIKDAVYKLMNSILNTGRHFNTSIWCVNHTPTGSKAETKVILNEAHTITFFPANMNRQLSYLLENYCNLDTKAIKKIMKMEHRWITIYRMYPQVMIADNHITMLRNITQDED